MRQFLAVLRKTGSEAAAMTAAKVTPRQYAWHTKNRPDFAIRCKEAKAAFTMKPKRQRGRPLSEALAPHQKTLALQIYAETGSLEATCTLGGFTRRALVRAREGDSDFAAGLAQAASEAKALETIAGPWHKREASAVVAMMHGEKPSAVSERLAALIAARFTAGKLAKPPKPIVATNRFIPPSRGNRPKHVTASPFVRRQAIEAMTAEAEADSIAIMRDARKLTPEMQAFLALLESGLSVAEAAERQGVKVSHAMAWRNCNAYFRDVCPFIDISGNS